MTYLVNARAHACQPLTNVLHVVGQEHDVEEQAVTVRDLERNGQTLDVTVAARALQPGALLAQLTAAGVTSGSLPLEKAAALTNCKLCCAQATLR